MIIDDSVRLSPIALPNFAVNGSIGTIANTAQKAALIFIDQTTANVRLILPAGTDGDTLTIINTGTVQVKVATAYISPNLGASWAFGDGTWNLVGEVADFVDLTASRAATISDHNKTLLASTPVTLTINANTFQYGIFRIRQTTDAGVITVAPGAGMVLVNPFGSATIGLDGAYMIVEVISNSIYVG